MNIDRKTVNTIRALSADMVQKANSGHPGLPLGAAPMAYLLYQEYMKFSGAHPDWINRDRFVLSGGHGSALLYSLSHLYGFGLSMGDLENFRQLDSKTPGHPEYGLTPGVEATTGPLGAGMAMAVGMTIATKHLAAIFNRPGFEIIDHYNYVLGGDGCMMEGISSEAFSLAGHLKLDKLIVLYDSNNISIEGCTTLAFTENVRMRMQAFGFNTYTVEDGDDLEEIRRVIEQAKAHSGRPSFIEVKTVIGRGCPAKEGKASAHGEPLGYDNVEQLKKTLGLDPDRNFQVSDDVYDHVASQREKGQQQYYHWQTLLESYFEAYPEMKKIWDKYFNVDYQDKIDCDKNFWRFQDQANATRNLSGITMNKLKNIFPNFIGGAADLAPSTKTYLADKGDFCATNYSGKNLHFGVRELAMAAIGNGMMLHGGLKTYVATFLVFSDYFKPMARLSALMEVPLTYVLTHDSIGLGEDGPTHQPVEHLTMLRAMPNFNVFRPCDATETNAGWYLAMTATKTPTALILSRQALPQIDSTSKEALKGGYIIDDSVGDPDIILIASGSEVQLVVEAKKQLKNVKIRVVSMPCLDIFKTQPAEYQEAVLPRKVVKRIVVEAGSRYSWGESVGLDGEYITMDGFGESAPGNLLLEKYGFTVANVVAKVEEMLHD